MVNLSTRRRQPLGSLTGVVFQLLTIALSINKSSQQDHSLFKNDPFYIDLQHKFGSSEEFTTRGSILIRPRGDHRQAQATIVHQNDLTENLLGALKRSFEQDDIYFLRATLREKKSGKNDSPTKIAQTIVKSCSLYTSNLADFITVNLSPTNEFLSINFFTTVPECTQPLPTKLSSKFNTTVLADVSPFGPEPDTLTYIKRLEEERQNKMKEGREDNRSFFAKYWIYIVPAVILLMMLGGPEQGAR